MTSCDQRKGWAYNISFFLKSHYDIYVHINSFTYEVARDGTQGFIHVRKKCSTAEQPTLNVYLISYTFDLKE